MKSIRLLLALLLTTAGVNAAKPPNVVFIFADDLGFGDLACYGHPYAKTPALDRLASQGTMFRQFYVTGVTCCPSRTGFMTSRHPASFPKYMADFGFGEAVTITALLKKRGYRTGHFGKWHMGPEEKDGTYGIDTVKVIGGSKESPRGRDEDLFSAAIEWIERNQNEPFYVNVWGHITHFPVGPLKSLSDRFASIPFKRADFGENMQPEFEDALAIGGDLKQGMQNYLGDVYSLDLQVGRLLKKLDELELSENTIVVFSSDHGPAPVKLSGTRYDDPARIPFSKNMLGWAGGLRGGKHNQYEGGVRAPFIVRWPGKVPAGRDDKTSVFSGFDWLPTLCHLAGVDIDVEQLGLKGENVSDIWFGSERSRRQPLMWRPSSENAKPAIRDGKWKLHAGPRPAGPVELYDLSRDKEERDNVAAAHPEVVKRLQAKLYAWTKTLPSSYEKKKKNRQNKRRNRKQKRR